MAEPASKPAEDDVETSADAAIALCDGDVRAALVYNTFLERKLDLVRDQISSGYTRGNISPARQASEKIDHWREIESGMSETENTTKSTGEPGRGNKPPGAGLAQR